MIHDQSRAGWFGASDTKFVMAENKSTVTWKRWWETKLGGTNHFTGNKYTRAGTLWEHPILEAIDENITMDGQILIPERRIRVNYDGYKDGVIYEIKTHSAKKEFEVTDDYWMQCQVEMYVYQEMAYSWFLPEFKKLYIVSYPMDEADYAAKEPHVNPNKLSMKEVKYDERFSRKYLRRVTRLARKLDRELGVQNEADIEQEGEGDPDID